MNRDHWNEEAKRLSVKGIKVRVTKCEPDTLEFHITCGGSGVIVMCARANDSKRMQKPIIRHAAEYKPLMWSSSALTLSDVLSTASHLADDVEEYFLALVG